MGTGRHRLGRCRGALALVKDFALDIPIQVPRRGDQIVEPNARAQVAREGFTKDGDQ